MKMYKVAVKFAQDNNEIVIPVYETKLVELLQTLALAIMSDPNSEERATSFSWQEINSVETFDDLIKMDESV